MAEILGVGRVYRPSDAPADEGDTGSGVLAAQTELYADVDLYEDGTVIERFYMTDAVYAGIWAEWAAGVATTVFEAALDTELAAFSQTSPITATQRANLVVTYSEVWP